jgi:NTP pyrophosphatase (non-canonical NTP hydrolase)
MTKIPTHPLHNPDDPRTSWALNPWRPMSKPIDLKHLGKLAEELGEASSAVARCIIQGIDESEPITGKSNRQWLEEELADVLANIMLVVGHFSLDQAAMGVREARKIEHLQGWHSMLEDPTHD